MGANDFARGAAHLGKTPGVWVRPTHAYKRGPATEKAVGHSELFADGVGPEEPARQ